MQFAIVLAVILASSALVLLWQYWTGALVSGEPLVRARPQENLESLETSRNAA